MDEVDCTFRHNFSDYLKNGGLAQLAQGKPARRADGQRFDSVYSPHSQAIEKRSLTYWKQKRKQNLSKEKQLKVYINVRGHVKVIKYER